MHVLLLHYLTMYIQGSPAEHVGVKRGMREFTSEGEPHRRT